MPANRSRSTMTTGFHCGARTRPEIGADTESGGKCEGECRIGAVAPMSDNAHGLRQSVSRAVATTLIDPPQVGASWPARRGLATGGAWRNRSQTNRTTWPCAPMRRHRSSVRRGESVSDRDEGVDRDEILAVAPHRVLCQPVVSVGSGYGSCRSQGGWRTHTSGQHRTFTTTDFSA
jgi:hypothetical protein